MRKIYGYIIQLSMSEKYFLIFIFFVFLQENGLIWFQYKLDLRIGKPMQIFIHQTDNSPKPVNHHLTWKEGPLVKSYHIRRIPAHDVL